MFKSRKKKRQEILEHQQNVKKEDFDFDRIALFFIHDDHSNAQQIIDDRTLNDLDFDDLFISMDRTSSSIGQQFLYSRLRVIPSRIGQSLQYDQYIEYMNVKPKGGCNNGIEFT